MESATPVMERPVSPAPAAIGSFRWLLHVGPQRVERVKHPLRRRWMFLGFTLLRAVVGRLPLVVAQGLGSVLGYVAYASLGSYRRLVQQHLGDAFGPTLTRATRRRIARGVFLNLGKTALEWLVIDRLSPSQIQRVVEVQGVRHLHQALAHGRGIVLVSAHFGNWELLPIAVAGLGFKGGVLARRLRYPEYESFLWSMRHRKAVTTYDRGSLKDVMRLLQANQLVGLIPDQDIDGVEGVFVDFFGRSAHTPVGPAALALMSGAPILPCFVVRNGRKFRVAIEEPLVMPRSGDRTQDLINLTQGWSRVVESYIRCYPDHWVWMHRRWKTRPEAGAARRLGAAR